MALFIDEKIETMIIDRRTMVRSALAIALERTAGVRICAQAATPVEALAALDDAKPSVILLALTDKQALGILANLLNTAYGRSVIVLAMADSPSLSQSARQYGAINMLSEDLALETLISTIEGVHGSTEAMQTGATERAFGGSPAHSFAQKPPEHRPKAMPNYQLDSAERAAAAGATSRIATLTRRERQVIGIIAAGLTSAESIKHLGITTSTFRHHLTSIFKKLELSNRVELTVFAYRYNIQ
jgi:DNA-binding NarL/FixJ family response regulator